MKPSENYIVDTIQLLAMTIVLLLFVSAWQPADGVFKKVNLFSDIQQRDPDDFPEYAEAVKAPEKVETPELLSPLISDNPRDTITPIIPYSVMRKPDSIGPRRLDTLLAAIENIPGSMSHSERLLWYKGPAPTIDSKVIQIEDYTSDSSAMNHFFAALSQVNEIGRPVRIAFIGDSFIEADILTCDLREMLQSIHGGNGVGFVPLSPIVRYQSTFAVETRNWAVSSVLTSRGIDTTRLLFGGQYFTPTDGASFSFHTTPAKSHAQTSAKASLLCLNQGNSAVSLEVNRAGARKYDLAPKSGLQLLTVDNDKISSVGLTIDHADKFTGYGFFFDDNKGVYVDNYSLRSSTGFNLLRTDPERLVELNDLMKYDLVILQYGLNSAEPDRTNFTTYQRRMVSVINYLRSRMPETSFLLFSIGDRNVNRGGEMVTPPGILAMVETQREIARETGIAFWNTFQAMGGRNGMRKFVQASPPLANKDYTHINYAGGRKIAQELFLSLDAAHKRYQYYYCD